MEHTINKKQGFSLVELAILLVVIGSIIAGAVSLLSLTGRQQQHEETIVKLDRIEEAILDFYNLHGYLPCPAPRTQSIIDADFGSTDTSLSTPVCASSAPSGTADTGSGAQEIRIGALPNRNLSLPDDLAIDGWDSKFTFVVIKDLAIDKATADAYSPPSESDAGVIQIFNGSGTTIPDDMLLKDDGDCSSSTCPIVSYLIISHGENASGVFSLSGGQSSCGSVNANEGENCNDDEIFIEEAISPTFDDILRWRTLSELQGAAEIAF